MFTSLATSLLVAAAAVGSTSGAASQAAIIECTGLMEGDACDRDDELCTRDVCAMIGASLECVADGNADNGTLCESDGDPCTRDRCQSGACDNIQQPEGASCSDGDLCTEGTTCDEDGECTGGSTTECDDDNSCTEDDCHPTMGCRFIPTVGETCDDGQFCTDVDLCDADGECSGDVPTCVDGNGCTSDSCDEDSDTCTNLVLEGNPCDDGDSCSTDDECTAEAACEGTQKNDGSECTGGGGCLIGGTCGPDGCTGTTPADDDDPCDDGDACTNQDQCESGSCEGAGVNCFDDDGCTVDVCDPQLACTYEEIEDCRVAPPDAGTVMPDASGFDGARLGGGGCGCEASSGANAVPILLLALFMLLRRGARSLLVLLLVFGGANAARAQGFAAQSFSPHPASSTFLSVTDGRILGHLEVHGSLMYDLADELLVFRDIETNEPIDGGEVIKRRQTLHGGIAVGLGDRFDVGLAFPLVLEQEVSPIAPGQDLGAAAGDLRLHTRASLFASAAANLSLEAIVSFPSGSDEDFTGDGEVAFTPGLAAGFALPRTRIGLQAGYRIRDKTGAGGLTVGDEVTYGAGVAIALSPARLWAIAEASGAIGVQGKTVAEEMPLEGLLGLQLRVSDHLVATAGSGAGLTAGYGAPRVRGVVGMAYRPAAEPPPPPPPAIDLEEDPIPVPVAPPRDTDGDGLLDPDDECPKEAEDFDQFEDENGCPDPDNDGDKILDQDDQCPLEAEVVNGIEDTDGCPDEGLIVMVEDRIVLDERVLFDVQRARVKRAARPVLQAIIDLFNQHPEWKSIVIEGHADQSGRADANRQLSVRRAERVKTQMIKQGMPAEKIQAVGYGETRPRSTETDPESRQKNRRVEFVIIQPREELKVIRPGQGGAAGEEGPAGEEGAAGEETDDAGSDGADSADDADGPSSEDP